MKIVVIGAGHGGLQAAKVLALGGADVTVYEKNSYEELSYDWVDDVSKELFVKLNIPLEEGNYLPGGPPALIAPFSDKPLQVDVPVEDCDWSVERRQFAQLLSRLAKEAGAKLVFGTSVDSLYFEDEKVRGIKVGGEIVKADLVIDSSGALSPFRASLPKAYRISAMPAFNEVFEVYRAFMEPAPNVKKPEFPKKIYLKHIGEDGISWCVVEPDGSVNILIGRIGELSPKTLDHALCELKKDNHIIGEKVRRGGIVCTIPIRYPLSRMGGDGYVAVGDSAFMTIPMIGSGIVNSVYAGQMLAEELLKNNTCDIKTLWRYQVRYYKERGAGHCSVDLIKRMLLSSDAEDIRYMFDKGVINKDDMQSLSSGSEFKLTPKLIIDKVIKGRKKLGFLIAFKNAAQNAGKAESFARAIPEEFDENAVTEWQKKLDLFYVS